MSTLRVSNIQDTSGGNNSTPADIANGTAKAWVNVDTTGTVAIRGSYNVTSITDNGVGDFTINFTNALADANYACCLTCNNRGGLSSPTTNVSAGYGGTNTLNTLGAYSTTALRFVVQSSAGTLTDISCVSAAIFR